MLYAQAMSIKARKAQAPWKKISLHEGMLHAQANCRQQGGRWANHQKNKT